MKINKKTIIILCIVLLLLLSILGGYTYSKYYTRVTGSGKIQVGKWAFKVNGETSQMANINLAQTYDESTLVEGRIAPGTKGSFDIVIDATGSETSLRYMVIFSETRRPPTLYWEYNGKRYTHIVEGIINANDENKIITMTIKWEWPFEIKDTVTGDAKDTEYGSTIEEYGIDVGVMGYQLNPQIAQ